MNRISLIVIGRNDSSILSKIYVSSYIEAIRRHVFELIYVDSNSQDDSVNLMRGLGFKVFKICRDEMCTAAAGRFVGTLESKGEYVLYLDSDMELANPDLIFHRFKNMFSGGERVDGCVGVVKDVYPHGGERIRIRKNVNNIALGFGGAVLLRRSLVIEAGSWRPNLLANEELDLQVRLELLGVRVRCLDDFRINHYTRQPSRTYELMSLYFPGLSVRYGSWGRLIRAQEKFQFVRAILAKNREVVFFPVVVFFIFTSPLVGGLLFFLYEIDLLRRKSFLYNFVVPGVVASILIGFFLKPSQSNEVCYEEV